MDASEPCAPPSSASSCPGCGKAVDPLRAGHVAILEGGFRYFCGATCKASYVDVTSKRLSLEALTAEPPAATVVRSGPRVREATPADVETRSAVAVTAAAETPPPSPSATESPQPPHFPPVAATLAEESPTTLRSAASGEIEDPDDDEDDERALVEPVAEPSAPPVEVPAANALPLVDDASDDDDAPRSVADALSTRDGRAAEARASTLARVAALAPFAGIALGVVAAAVGLAGDAASALRLPLALLAAGVLAAHGVLGERNRSAPSPWVVVLPVVVAAAGAVLAVAQHDPHADAHAAYVGLAAAAALVVDILVTRTRRDVSDARARIAAALEVPADVVQGDTHEEVRAADVKPGEQVVVEAGGIVAVDGTVAAGEAEVAPWLDSPVVTTKREGDAVVAGATLVSGRLRITTTFAGPDRAWLRLAGTPAARVEVAAPLVAGARRIVERGAVVLGLLAGAAAYANNGSAAEVVIAASAGAFVLAAASGVAAAALAHARGHVAAQRRGIVYKDARAFDAAARAEVGVVCSRGTILLGAPEIVAVEAVAAKSSDAADTSRVLALAAGAEMAANDAVAAAILRAARARGVRPETVRSALVHAGLGVSALVANGDKVVVGSRAFLLEERVSVALADARTSELEAEGRSVLLVAVAGRLVGLLALQDGLRPGARAAVQRLHDARIEPVFLSGEARDTCETIARALDIEHVRPEVLPAERGAEVRALADGGRVVAAIGHPSADDGALGAADVSVAMSAAGAAPGEWAVALASDDVRDAALALTVPRACRERAKTALLVGAVAQGISLVAIAFGAAPPVVSPVLAVAAATFALSVVRDPTTSPGR